jgi:uncharacterized membrane protein YqiK
MKMMNLTAIAITAGVILVALLTMGSIFAKLYRRATKEQAFVRTGFRGQRVIMDGGAVVLPVMHDLIWVNMNTLRLEVKRAAEGALITKDRMRVDVMAEFYVRVQPTVEAIADAAQTLGHRTQEPEDLKELVEGKFVDALRAVAAEMTMEELHEQRVEFVQKVQTAVSEDLLKNGLELETVSLTSLDQTDKQFFNPNNAFDAEGLTKLTEEIEARRKKRNDIEQDTAVAVSQKNLSAEREQLEVGREEQYARLAQEREIETRRAFQQAEIAKERAAQKKQAEEAQIIADRQVQEARIQAERELEQLAIKKQEAVALQDQDRHISVANKSRDESEAKAEADKARANAVDAEEAVVTVREQAKAEREKIIELVEARKRAERDAISITVAAEAEKRAADDTAAAVQRLAEGEAEKERIAAQAEAEAEKMRADAARLRYAADAEGRRSLNEADNLLTPELVAMRVKLALIENVDAIIRESVKPMEAIDSLRIVHVDGLTGGAPAAHGGDGGGNGVSVTDGNLADQAVNAALRYRAQAPLLDSLLKEVGIEGGELTGLAAPLHVAKTVEAKTDEAA